MATGSIAAAPHPESTPAISPLKTAWQRFGTPLLVVLMALAIALTITRNWNAWEGGRIEQVTNDAYVKRDLTPLSTKVVGLVREVKVNDYQQVRKGDELVLLADDDYRAQVAQAIAAVDAAKAALENNRRQRDLQDARIERALAGIDQAQAQIAAAQAGKVAVQADVSRTNAERTRQEALVATGSTTRQRVEVAVADAERFAAQFTSREADLTQARTLLRSNELAVVAERRSRAVLESQELQLVADLHAKEAALAVARGQSRLHAHPRAGRRHRRRTAGAPRTAGLARHAGLFVRRRDGLGTGQLPRNAADQHQGRRPGRRPHRCVSGRTDERPGARDRARQRIAVRAPAARQRDRQLHEGRAARAGQDRPRRFSAGDAVAIGAVGGGHDSNEVVSETERATMSNAPAAAASDPIAKPDRIAALRSVLPADLAHSPLLGIVGVIMGAGISSLAARLLSLGLADLRGHLGIGIDEGAWIGTAFNTATVFIGPLTVYLGALLGARRVLLVAGVVFAAISACLPFVHSYSLLIVLLAIAGLSSGTFYPLTISFALLNVPLRYLALTLGVYATCIEGALNFAPSLYGFYRDHWSWAWMFWTSAVVSPIMVACVYYGVPASRRPAPSGPKPSFRGFLYFSAGIALLFAAIDQGQRLDWWRSGLFTALFASGAFLLLCAVVRRMRAPNPLVDLPYLRQWNTIALAVALFSFRFVLLATALVIPQSLSSGVSTPRSSVPPCCGSRWRRCSWRCSRRTCSTRASIRAC